MEIVRLLFPNFFKLSDYNSNGFRYFPQMEDIMNEIFVTGHRNPDTDSIVAAISYASLRNALGDRNYIPVHLDHINDETQRILDYFGFDAPARLRNVRTQICDLEYDTPPALNSTVSIDRAWDMIQEQGFSNIPVINEDGTLYGMLSAGEITEYYMKANEDGCVENVPIFNLMSVLEGRLISDTHDKDTLSGDIVIALPQDYEEVPFHKKESIVICGCQPEMIRRALDFGVECLIICQTEINPEWIKDTGNTCIIATPFDARYTSSQIIQAVPISGYCNSEKVICFHLKDYIDEVREKMTDRRDHYYPVLDEQEKVVGTLSRYHLMRPKRKQVVLVDHNEIAQAVPGLNEAEILEIIDHHRLADIQTIQPIRMRNEPVGSTTTIIAYMYQEHGVIPSKKLAGLMVSAILSDTVMFKSPTCTKRDIAMAERLARIAGVTLEEIGKTLFSTSYETTTDLNQLIMRDFKEFHIGEQKFGVGQITCLNSASLLEHKSNMLEILQTVMKNRKYSFIMLMITDVLLGGTQLLYVGPDDIIRHGFNLEPKDNIVFLPGVMSRKKQVIPMLTDLWG